MFKEILKIIPTIDAKDLKKMSKSLGDRFGQIGKKFGKGLIGALAGGGLAGLGLGLIDKLLNPLKETQEAIDKMLSQSDDLVTNAKQFGTTAGRLAKLQAIGQSTGLDAESLNMLLAKFQTSVAEAAADPNKQTSVRQFVGEKDTAEAFFQFIQGLQKLDKNQQVLVQQEVFGEKQLLRMADFLQTDFKDLNKYFANISTDKLDASANKLGNLNDLKDTLGAVRNLNDMISKGGKINEGMVRSQDAREKLALDRENQQIQSYQSLATISEASMKITAIVEKGLLTLTDLLNRVTGLTEMVKRLAPSRIFKGLGSFFGGDDK